MTENSRARPDSASAEPSFRELFTPKLITVLREGYDLSRFKADAIAGLTVAIVALPLSMAIAIASGVGPEKGLFTAIIGGFLISLLGGSRFQIGGPAGAFIILVAATVSRQGVDGLILATLLSGVMLAVAGWLRLGTYIKFIPYPVTVGFTAGIAIIIFASQLTDLFGLTLSQQEPGDLIPKLKMLLSVASTVNPAAVMIAVLTIGIIVGLKRWRPSWPGMLIAVTLASIVASIMAGGFSVETIGSRFGGIPSMLPAPALPNMSIAKVWAVLPDAVAFTLLGAIESLLSAVVADGMTGRRHRSNCELVAQGAANIGSALFGGICVTGTIARTATNVRAGAHGPVAGMLHALFLLAFMLLAAPLASYIPLAALASVLTVVAWNMIERPAFKALILSSRGDAAVLLITFALVVFRDLTTGIVVGFALGSLLFIGRMAKAIEINAETPLVADDVADDSNGGRTAYDVETATDPDIVVYRISGAFFFGAAATVGSVLDRIAETPKIFILDCSAIPLMDSTAANVLESVAHKAARQGVLFYIAGASPKMRKLLTTHGVKPPLAHYRATVASAKTHARAQSRQQEQQAAQ